MLLAQKVIHKTGGDDLFSVLHCSTVAHLPSDGLLPRRPQSPGLGPAKARRLGFHRNLHMTAGPICHCFPSPTAWKWIGSRVSRIGIAHPYGMAAYRLWHNLLFRWPHITEMFYQTPQNPMTISFSDEKQLRRRKIRK